MISNVHCGNSRRLDPPLETKIEDGRYRDKYRPTFILAGDSGSWRVTRRYHAAVRFGDALAHRSGAPSARYPENDMSSRYNHRGAHGVRMGGTRLCPRAVPDTPQGDPPCVGNRRRRTNWGRPIGVSRLSVPHLVQRITFPGRPTANRPEGQRSAEERSRCVPAS